MGKLQNECNTAGGSGSANADKLHKSCVWGGVAQAASSAPGFKYFASKSDWSEAKLTDDSKAIKVKMGTVPSTVSGASYQPTDSYIGLTVGDPLTWWIVGSNGSYANLYAEKALCRTQFNAGRDSKSYSTSWGCSYSGGAPSEVYGSHYGGSDIRNRVMKNLHTQLFKSGEVGIVADSRIECRDQQSGSMYTVTDKMYLPSAGSEREDMHSGSSYKTIYVPSSGDTTAGANNQIPLKYWSGGANYNSCWLRSPSYNLISYSLLSYSGSYVRFSSVSSSNAVAVAFKINLSNLSFSSSARSAAVTANQSGGESLASYEGVQSLRLKNSADLGAKIVRKSDYSMVKAKLGAAPSGTHYLMVQGVGADGTNYAYAREIKNQVAEIKVSDITATTVSSFENAKAWIERAPSSSDGQILYASNLTTVNADIPPDFEPQIDMGPLYGESDSTSIKYGQVATVKKLTISEDVSGVTYGWYKGSSSNPDSSGWTQLNSELSYRCKKEDVGSYLMFQVKSSEGDVYSKVFSNPISYTTINDIATAKSQIGNGNNGIMVNVETLGISEIQVNDVQDLLLASVIVDCGKSDLNIKFNCQNLDMTNQNYIPLGSSKEPYKGKITGNNCTISNYQHGLFTGTIDASTKAKLSEISNIYDEYAGLVGNMNKGSITGLTMTNAKLSHKNYVGTFLGFGLDCTIENCSVSGLEITAKWECIGGIAAALAGSRDESNGKMNNCSVSNINKFTAEKIIGGVVGDGYNININNCSCDTAYSVLANNYNCTVI